MRRIADNLSAFMQLAYRAYQQTGQFVDALSMYVMLRMFCVSLIFLLLTTTGYAVPPGTTISNIATANFDVSGIPQTRPSNNVDVITTVSLSPATISFLQYSPTGSGATPTNSSPTGCSTSGLSGPFPPLPNPTYLGFGALNAAAPLNLAPASVFHQGEPIFVHVADANRNIDSSVRDTLVVTIRSIHVGDQEILELTETDVNTGEFVGYIQSVTTPMTPFDCVLAVESNEQIQVSYTDIFDNTDVVNSNILVDPFGIVFNSETGEPVNGVIVTLINTATNTPAAVFGDDLVSAYPSTVVTGGSVTDAGSTIYNFGPGEYRFPSVAPGTYRIDVIANEYVVPSIVGEAELQALPNAPFAIDANASYGQEFSLVVGPPLNVDVPIDPIPNVLFVTKESSKQEVAVGDFMQYEISVTNNRSSSDAMDVQLVDRLPTGFRFQEGSTQINGVNIVDPSISPDGQTIIFSLPNIGALNTATIKYVVEITSGAPFGSAINSAHATDSSGFVSNVAQAGVSVIDDLLSTRSFLIGSVIEGECQSDEPTNDAQIEYQLESKLHGAEMIHVSTINQTGNISSDLAYEVMLPKLLAYERSSASINGELIADPVQEGDLLRFTLNDKMNDMPLTLRFATRLNSNLIGRYELKARLNATNKINNQWISNLFSIEEKDKSLAGMKIDLVKAESGVQVFDLKDTSPIKGVENIRLYLEDGRYVLTDERGMYHFEAIEPGSHVVQLDTSTIPDHLEIADCIKNTRFAGAKHSRFVDIEAGLLWRANFYLRKKQQSKAVLNTRLESSLKHNAIEYTLTIDSEHQALENVRASVILPDGLAYLKGSTRLNGAQANDPNNTFGTLTYSLSNKPVSAWQDKINFVVEGAPSTQGEIKAQVLITFDQGQNKNQRSSVVENTILFQKEKVITQAYTLRPRFELLSAKLKKEELYELENLFKGIDKQNIVQIHIAGHTDNVPVSKRNQHLFENNQILSMARAKTVAEFIKHELELQGSKVIVQGLGDSQPIANNDTAEGRALNRRVELEVKIKKRVRDERFEAVRNDSGKIQTEIKTSPEFEKNDENTLPQINVVAEPKFDKAWLDKADNSLKWLLPTKDANPEISSVDIAIKHKRDEKIVLHLNGNKVSNLHLDSKLSSTDGQRMITHWRGVDVTEGDNNFTAITYNSHDQVQNQITHTVHFSGQPIKAELVPKYSRLNADGRNSVIVAVRFYDRWGYPVRSGVVGNYDLSPEYSATDLKRELDEQPLSGLLKNQTRFRVADHGIAYIEIEPTTRSGKIELDFEFIDNRKQTVTAWLTAQQQEWILVGIAEGTAGYNNISGNTQALDDHQHEDNLYEDGRLAFYGKGKVKGEWLLTLAYDSDRKERNSSERLFQTIDPDEYYTLYGDATEQQFDAASARKVYVKLEKQQFYALFGDFNTNLTVTELARYSRSMTGAKSEYEGERIGFNAFAADTNQVFVRNEIQGNGTSGLYRLSEGNIVINSEKVRLETRDRFRPQIVISQQELNQFSDYSIDTVNGTLFFKQPIQSRDENFNPIYIVVDYEVVGSNDRQVTAGGRANVFSKDKKLEVGVSGIAQGDTSTKGHLVAVDATYNVSNKTEVRLEAAKSKTTIDDDKENSTAYLAEVEHRSERVDANAYFRRQAAAFGLEQQSINNNGSKRYGVDARYKIKEDLSIEGEVYRDEALREDNKRSIAEVELLKSEKTYQLGAGMRYAKDEKEDGEDDDSLLATGRASRYLLDSKLQVRGSAEVELSNDNSVDHPTRYIAGIDYKLNQVTELFAEHEYTQGEDQDTNTSRLGTRLTPWPQASIDSSVSQQTSEDGSRLFSNLGFTQGWQYSENLNLDFSVDRSDTLRNPGGQAFNSNVALSSGTLSEDFTSASVGASYTQENWSSSSRVEYRTSDADISRSLFLGFYREQDTGFGMALDAQVFDSNRRDGGNETQADLNYSIAYRPDDSPFTVLNRFDLNYDNAVNDSSRIRTRKVINNLNLNYTVDRIHQFGAHWGFKYTLDNIDGEEYDGITNLLGFQYRYDWNQRVDLSLHGDILHSTNSDNFKYSFGPSVGVNVYKNVWLSVGYNVDGFEDEDFSSAEFTANGPYVKMRLKFDADTVRGLLGK